MQISGKDFGGIESFDIALEPGRVTLLAGRNRAGKTSIMNAVAHILTGEKKFGSAGTPIDMVRTDTKVAFVKRIEDGDVETMSWSKDGALKDDQLPPLCGVHSAGIEGVQLHELPPKERAAILIKLLGALPTEEEIDAELISIGLAPDDVGELIETLTTLGWERALVEETDKQKALKGKWCAFTGKRAWAGKDGDKWLPDGWTDDLRAMSETALIEAIATAETLHEQAIKSEAVNDAEIAKLRTLAESIGHNDQAAKDAKEAAEICSTDLICAKALLQAIVLPGQPEPTIECFHCKTAQVIRGGKSCEPKAVKHTKAEEAKIIKEHAEVSARIAKLSGELATAEAAYRTAIQAQTLSAHAFQRMQQIDAAPKVESSLSSAQCKANIHQARIRLGMFQSREKALATHLEIEQQVKIVAMLDPSGLRQTKLIERLDAFNAKVLKPICDAAKWQAIKIESDMTILTDTPRGKFKSYASASKSERYKIRAVLRIAIARLKKDVFVLLDDLDDLDKDARPELFGMLVKLKVGALVAIAAVKPEEVPDLERMSVGHTYWIADGKTQPIGALAATV